MTWTRVRRLLKVGLGFYLPLTVVLVLLFFPFYWMLITSLKGEREIFDLSRPLWVWNPTLHNYRYLLSYGRLLFARWSLNSVVITLITTAFSLIVSTMAGYAIARLRFVGAVFLGTLIFVTYLVPRSLLCLPISQLMSQINLLGKPITLVLAYPTFLIPYCTWLLTGYFRTIPIDMEECAMIDGCTRIGAVRRITLPLAVPGILTAGIFAFTLSWNELLYALVLVTGETNRTLAVGVTQNLIVADYYFWGPLMAAAVLSSIPVAVLYFFFMDLYVKGLTAGAVKG